jgi:glycosyltransferase involved in cell wall biosynthesis
MAVSSPVTKRTQVSVIVPARNEETSLGRCLESLIGQTDVESEILVVDDGSTDRTREIALSFRGVRVIDAPPLPAGWSGKSNAVAAGASAAMAEWLLFTDADTFHLPGSLARAMAEASEHDSALLSYSPEQEVVTFWEKAVMPVVFAELASVYRPAAVCDPNKPVAAANGQYILIRRDVYKTVGGHAAVAHTLLEDVALARLVKGAGFRIRFRLGRGQVRARMYRTFAELREGWTKNLAVLFLSPMRLALRRAIEGIVLYGALGVGLVAAWRGQLRLGIIAIAIFAVFYGVFLKRILKAHFLPVSSVLAVVGLPIFSYLLARSALCYKRGSVSWKGRNYPAASAI